MKALATLFLFFGFALCAAEGYQPYYVGELGSRWQFPSDHLPRGATVGDFHIAFWNVLNKDYLHHIEENGQGLRHSAIMRDNIPFSSDTSITVREAICGAMIMEMINHPTHPRSLIALQETHRDMHRLLALILPSQWKIVTPPGQPESQDIFLYDSTRLDLIDVIAVKYSEKFAKTIFTITVEEKSTGRPFRFVQSHIPGGPINSAPGCAKFAEEAWRQFDAHLTLILMGDMNQSPDVIEKAIIEAGGPHTVESPYTYLPIAHPSHINTNMEASWIDHFFSYSPCVPIKGSDQPEELSTSVVPMVQLLQSLKQGT